MNYEEKYKDALERAKKEWLNNLDNAYKNYRERLEIIFPELKKSEDEKIREDLMEWFKEFPDMIWRNHYKTDVLEWFEKQREKDKLIEELLEKQGEQKPYGQRKKCFDCQFNYAGECKGFCQMKRDEQIHADKIEPKFKVGDWIVSKYMHLVMQILNNNNGFYETVETDGTERNDSYDYIDRNFKLWSITDAKDGNVLQLGKVTAIFQEYIGNGNCKCYCSVCDGEFEVPSQDSADNSYGCHNATPATKEQRDALIKAMTDTGYTFNFKTKELKGLKFDTDDIIEENYQQQADDLIDMVTEKSAWSKEDERIYQSIIDDTVQENQLDIKQIDWLKSLKGRVQPQSKQEWSEEDNKRIERIYDFLWKHKRGFSAIIWQIEEDANWLKSLKPHNTWKPSEEQMDVLETAVSSLQSNTLESLYQDLKREKL